MKGGSFDSYQSALSGTGADIGGEPELEPIRSHIVDRLLVWSNAIDGEGWDSAQDHMREAAAEICRLREAIKNYIYTERFVHGTTTTRLLELEKSLVP